MGRKGREWKEKRRQGGKEGKGKKGREVKEKRIGREKGRMKGLFEKWEGWEGNQVSGNFIHPWKPISRLCVHNDPGLTRRQLMHRYKSLLVSILTCDASLPILVDFFS